MAIVTCAGCSEPPNPDGRVNVSGTITLNGKPLEGMAGITFDPAPGGVPGSGGKSQISQGAYSLTGYDAVKPGKFIVRIFATVDFDKSTGKIADNQIVFGNEVPVDILPPEFNKDSKIEFEALEGKSNTFNFDIQTDFVPKMPKKINSKEPVPL